MQHPIHRTDINCPWYSQAFSLGHFLNLIIYPICCPFSELFPLSTQVQQLKKIKLLKTDFNKILNKQIMEKVHTQYQ